MVNLSSLITTDVSSSEVFYNVYMRTGGIARAAFYRVCCAEIGDQILMFTGHLKSLVEG